MTLKTQIANGLRRIASRLLALADHVDADAPDVDIKREDCTYRIRVVGTREILDQHLTARMARAYVKLFNKDMRRMGIQVEAVPCG